MDKEATVEVPIYKKVQQENTRATPLFLISCDEGWRLSIVCADMYGWTADWLVEQLQGKPFAPQHRPDRKAAR